MLSNITVYSNKINGFCGLDFVAWISLLGFHLDFSSVSDAVLIHALPLAF